ncbi:copper amine oxidase N-terminal domain-containing protein [Desulforamulus ruminis]|uniref:Copper amine oxidase-like domain-containing protein n=1 Tax=Desulforamulus ruminis (strain ATCC 23193 / DSM 2154 / NCIMB 8452 / DL) TaxID=696281 RepID=F6DR03_DESRL|nr:copper amine oxidase N-terminal domain-containing protein [Desulforamulus ruminis]AEG59722.1 copper amine oxidase-like domain-containing protein [Desulforamulus ruminis DSM 2154]
MRKKLTAVLTLCLLLLSTSLAMAAAPPTIYINEDSLVTENPAVIEEGRTLLPLRAIFEAMGQEVGWNAEDQSITSGGIWLQIDNPTATVDGVEVTLDVPAKIIDNSTYVPLRFIAESLGKDVNWDGDQNRIDIMDKPATDADQPTDEELTTDEETTTDEEIATDEEEVTADDNAANDETDEDSPQEDTVDVDEVE